MFEYMSEALHNQEAVLHFVPQTAGGIYLPDSKLGKTNEGEVVAVGPGRFTETGTRIPVNVVVGDTVLLPEYGGTTLTLDDEELSLFRDEDILGKFQVCSNSQPHRDQTSSAELYSSAYHVAMKQSKTSAVVVTAGVEFNVRDCFKIWEPSGAEPVA